jgi:acetyltransferase-like isoleucine patch superfamily enzyme
MKNVVKKLFTLVFHRRSNQTDITGLLLPEYEIGKETYGKPIVLSWGSKSTLRIGSYCSIGGDVQILLGGNHRIDWVTTFPFPARWKEAAAITGHPASKGDIVIENDIWIGRQSVILSGVTIHTGAVIGCNSVVSRNVPPYTVVAGNPAREIKKRFSENQIARLLASRWWELDREAVVDLLPLLCSAAIDAFCDTVEKRQKH